jgi:hypothetical protein
LFIVSCVVIVSGSVGFGRDQEKRKILVLADEWEPMHALERSINGEGRYLVDTADQESLPGNIGQYRFILMYVHNALEANTEKALITYAREGGALVVLHHGLASAKMSNRQWLDFLGIDLYPTDDLHYPWRVLADTTHVMVNLYPGHYITSNGIHYQKVVHFHSDYPLAPVGTFPAFELPDTEVFLNQRFAAGSERTVLFGVATPGGEIMQPTSGWYRKEGKGWLFYFQAGHGTADFADSNFSQIIRNTLHWVAN